MAPSHASQNDWWRTSRSRSVSAGRSRKSPTCSGVSSVGPGSKTVSMRSPVRRSTVAGTVPATVERRTGDRIETVFEPGPTELTPEQVGDFLDLPAETDLDRLVRHQSFWDAWLGAIHASSNAAPPSGA